MAGTAQGSAIRRFGVFEINPQSGELRKSGMRLRLSGQPFQVLAILVERAGEVVTREELHSTLWPAQTFVDFDHGLNNAVARIREMLDDSAGTPRYVETIPRRGYRFIAPLTGGPAVIVPAPMPLVAEREAISSPAVADAVGSRASIPAHLKTSTPKHPGLMLTGAVLVAVLAPALMIYHHAGPRGVRSLAVLPLKNLSGDQSQEYLADSMTEEITGRLAGIRDLRVISRTSAMCFKKTALSAPQIAKTLGVDTLVEGSIVRQGNRIRIHAQLIRAATDEHFWSAVFDRDMGDVLALQSEIAEGIADRVRVTVTGQEHIRLIAARYVSPEVYENYMKGQFGPHNTAAEIEESIAYFQKAIGKDPTFAPAYIGLAHKYVHLSTIFVGQPPAVTRPKAMEEAQKALELDPNLAEAHAVIADIEQRQWRWKQAESEYKRALQLKPSDAAAHMGFADWLVCQGRIEEGLGWARRARELDPLGDSGDSLGFLLFQARRYDEANRELRSALAVYPDAAYTRWLLGFNLIGKGKPEEAITELERTAAAMQRSPGTLEMLATAYAHAGRRADALRLIDELKERRQRSYVPAGSLINPYLALGDYDEAFLWFEQAYAEQSNILQYLKVHPFFDPVRHDPRFQDLLRRVGLQ